MADRLRVIYGRSGTANVMRTDMDRGEAMRQFQHDHDGHTYETLWIRSGDLYIDPAYQRRLDQGHIKKLEKVWSDEISGVLTVNVRDDGTLAVIDGQHRLAVRRKRYGLDDRIPCVVYYGLSIPEEARVFAAVNGRTRKAVHPSEAFKARLIAHDPIAEGIVAVCDALDIRIRVGGSGHTHGGVQALATVEDIYTAVGAGGLRDVLSLIQDVWGEDPRCYTRAILGGTYVFLLAYRDTYDRDHLIRRLSRVSWQEVERRVGMMTKTGANIQSISSRVARVLYDLYNARLTTNALPFVGPPHTEVISVKPSDALARKNVWRALVGEPPLTT